MKRLEKSSRAALLPLAAAVLAGSGLAAALAAVAAMAALAALAALAAIVAPDATASPAAAEVGAAAPAAAGAPAMPAATVAAVKARGTLVMLCFPHQENPFIRVKTEIDLNHYDGIDYEVMEGFARSLGVQLAVHPVKPTFAALVPALLAGQGDVIASSFSITPERRAKVDFSAPYFAVHAVVVVPSDSTVRYVSDLYGKTAATVPGSSQEERIQALHPGRIHHVDFTRWNYDAVAERAADFTVVDDTSTWRLLRFYPHLRVAFPLPGTDTYGYAVAPGSDLRSALDRYLQEARASGQLAEIVRRYLGDSGAALVAPQPPAAHP
jgi:ABC-type amino acid transport substrate-binding protein